MRHIDAQGLAALIDRRKVLGNMIPAFVGDIQVDTVEAPFLHFIVNRPCNNIPTRKLCPGIVGAHKG